MADKSGALNCEKWYDCKIMVIPHVVRKTLGAGWIFPKQSMFLPIFKHYFNMMKEGAIQSRVYSSYSDPAVNSRVCPKYAGNPIGLEKTVTLLGIFTLGAGLSVALLL
jgi:hypothetical protein